MVSAAGPLSFDRELPSGLGERLGVLMCVAAYGYLLDTTVHACWLSRVEDNPEARQYDLAELFATGFRFPERLRVTDDVPAFRETWQRRRGADAWVLDADQGELPGAHAYDCVPQLAYRTMRVRTPGESAAIEIDAAQYLAAYRAACAALRWPAPWPVLDGMRYTALHLRGDDKNLRRPEDFITAEAIAAVQAAGLGPIVLVTDDRAAARRWLEQYPELLNSQAWVAGHSNTVAAVRDLSILAHAVAILQHVEDGWSAYSSFAAMAGRVPLLSTWRNPEFHRLDLFAAEGGRPEELFRHDELALFVPAAQARKQRILLEKFTTLIPADARPRWFQPAPR